MLLVGVGFIAGVVTAVSPCVLPVLPILFAGSAAGSPRRPYAIVAGLVASFTAFTLAATALLSALGLPGDFLRNVAIGVVLLVGLSLVWPELSSLVGRPFHALARRRPADIGGGFLLGASLGLLFTPCAGPVIAAVASLAATRRFSVEAVAITLAYALGAGTVLLGVAIAARRGFDLAAVRARAPVVRRGLGGVIAAVAVLMIFGLDTRLAAHVPGYTRSLQGLEESAAAQNRLGDLLDRGAGTAGARVHGSEDDLRDFGRAPEFEGIRAWLNSTPLTLEKLRGKVVLIDFWTYSCVNCLRTLPHLARWYETYVDRGLVVVGVHTPEFAFEAEPGNVRRAVADLHIRYPVALDSDYRTWTAWGNRYWPAKYLVDRRGHVRYVHFGEGRYEESEDAIRTLLAENNLPRPVSPSVADTTPSGPQTPELYLGYARLANLVGSNVEPDKEATYEIPTSIPLHTFGYGGRWTVEAERIVAGKDARLELHFEAAKVHLVLGTSSGPKSVTVALDGNPPRALAVNEDRLYTLAEPGGSREHLLELRFSPGTEAYAFTFG